MFTCRGAVYTIVNQDKATYVLLIALFLYFNVCVSVMLDVWCSLTSISIHYMVTIERYFYWSACTKLGQWAVIYVCVMASNWPLSTPWYLILELFWQCGIFFFSFYYTYSNFCVTQIKYIMINIQTIYGLLFDSLNWQPYNINADKYSMTKGSENI